MPHPAWRWRVASGNDDVRLAFARAPEAINERGRLGRRGSIRPIETLQCFIASDRAGVEERVVRAIDEPIVFTRVRKASRFVMGQ